MSQPGFSALRDVRRLGETPEAYLVTVDLDWETHVETAEYVARPGGGGLADAIVAAIAAGAFAGDIAPPGPPPPPAAPTDLALGQKQWLWALRKFGLRPGVEATIAALAAGDPDAAAELEAAVFGSQRYAFADALALIDAYRPALAVHAPAIAGLDAAQLAAMWAEAAAKTFTATGSTGA